MGNASAPQQHRGLFQKFTVTRTDGRHRRGQKHEDCRYFVLDLSHDTHAFAALRAYAESCEQEFPMLASDLRRLCNGDRRVLYKIKPPTRTEDMG